MQNSASSDDMMSEMNMTPFVDVMLVLLVIFLVALPIVHQTIQIDLPKVSYKGQVNQPDPVEISITQEGQYLLNKEETRLEVILEKLVVESQRDPKPVVLLYADQNVRYEYIARVLASVHQSGLGKIGFVTQDQRKE